MIQSINPTTQEVMKTYDTMTREQVEEKIQKAHHAFLARKKTSFQERSRLMNNLTQVMKQQTDELAQLDTMEMGMLYKDAKGDVTKSMSNITYFADNAAALLADKPFDQDGLKGKIIYQPKGVIFSIMPRNYPYNQALRSAIPNIMAGNVVLMKHASNVPQVAEKLEQIFLAAGFPEGVYTNLFIPHDFTEKIIAHPYVIGANVTGSEIVGKELWSLAGKYLKPSILELGGNDAFVVLETKDIDNVVKQGVKGRFSNHGQKCNSSKRFIVIDSMYDAFVEKFTQAVQALKVGDPMDESTDIGPLAKISAVKFIDEQVQKSIQQWARVLTGGKRAEELWSNYYLPTVLVDVAPGMPVFDEEVFGPVAPIIKANSLEEILELINNSVYGLWCSIFGDDLESKKFLAEHVEVSNAFLDKVVTSYAFLPYGGIKNTGYGKELSEHGLKAFMNEKVIVE